MLWNYMKRNRTFRFGDAMMILDLKKETLKTFVFALHKAGYLVWVDVKDFKDRVFRLVKFTGIRCPMISVKEVFDYNTGEVFVVKGKKDE